MSLPHIDELEMLAALRGAYRKDPEQSFLALAGGQMSEPIKPKDVKGRLRIHPVWLTFVLTFAFVLGVFLYFTFAR